MNSKTSNILNQQSVASNNFAVLLHIFARVFCMIFDHFWAVDGRVGRQLRVKTMLDGFIL